MSDPEPITAETQSYYVRERHAMAVYGDFGPIFEDHYLHLMQIGVRLEPAQDEMLKDALAVLSLHLTSRPRDETIAWTLNFREPPLNLFVTGDSLHGNVVGRVFTEDVKVFDTNLFFSQVTRPRSPVRKSTVDVQGRDIPSIVEQYYDQSEQLPAKLFRMDGDAYAMMVAQPDIDMEWFSGLTAESMKTLEEDEEIRLLERRRYRFACGCNLATILNVLVNALGRDTKEILAGQEFMEVRCPRCGGTFRVDESLLDTFLVAMEEEEARREKEREEGS